MKERLTSEQHEVQTARLSNDTLKEKLSATLREQGKTTVIEKIKAAQNDPLKEIENFAEMLKTEKRNLAASTGQREEGCLKLIQKIIDKSFKIEVFGLYDDLINEDGPFKENFLRNYARDVLKYLADAEKSDDPQNDIFLPGIFFYSKFVGISIVENKVLLAKACIQIRNILSSFSANNKSTCLKQLADFQVTMASATDNIGRRLSGKRSTCLTLIGAMFCFLGAALITLGILSAVEILMTIGLAAGLGAGIPILLLGAFFCCDAREVDGLASRSRRFFTVAQKEASKLEPVASDSAGINPAPR